jgi:hypothetical protein
MIPGIDTPSPPQGSESNRSRENSRVNIHNPTNGTAVADQNTSIRNTSQYNIKNTLCQASRQKQLSSLQAKTIVNPQLSTKINRCPSNPKNISKHRTIPSSKS